MGLILQRLGRRRPFVKAGGKGKVPDPNAVADAHLATTRKVLVRELDNAWSDADLQRIARAMRDRDVAVVRQLLPAYSDDDPGRYEGLAEGYRDAVKQIARESGSQTLASVGVRGSFRIDNPYTTRWLNERTAELITNITEDSRAVIKDLVSRAWAEGIPPDELAGLIRPHIGLTEIQAGAVERRWESTVRQLEAQGMDRVRALGTAAERTTPYADDLRDQRADTIARTETIAASSAGAHDAWRDAKDQGLLPDNVMREWTASPEGKGACDYCFELDGERVAFDDPFETDAPGLGGTIDRPPLHPRCRCVVRLIVPGLNDLQTLEELRTTNEAENG